MTSSRVTVTLPAELREAAQDVAERSGRPFSAVVAEALSSWMRGQLVDEWLMQHQAEHGEFDEDELKAIARKVGVPYVPPARSVSAA